MEGQVVFLVLCSVGDKGIFYCTGLFSNFRIVYVLVVVNAYQHFKALILEKIIVYGFTQNHF